VSKANEEFLSARPDDGNDEVLEICHPRGFSVPFGRQKEHSKFFLVLNK
jgi:hypothetical protein